MKIIHTADIHIGSKMDSNFSLEIAKQRKVEIKDSFLKMIQYAEKNNIRIIMLCGDVFDLDEPNKKDLEFFYNVILDHPSIDFLYLKGNHDNATNYFQELSNLKTFLPVWTYYKYENVVISGIELNDDNINSFSQTLILQENSINIVMLHGQIANANNNINLTKLRNKNIDYLALGHIHSYKEGPIDDRGNYCYCGILEPRGFDEIGQKGFVELEISNKKVFNTFIPFSKRIIKEIEVDITGLKDTYSILKKITEDIVFDINNIYRIVLVGNINAQIDDLSDDLKVYLKDICYFIDIKDNTKKVIDISKYEHDLSLKGEFVRLVYNNSNYNEKQKVEIISLGLKMLEGK